VPIPAYMTIELADKGDISEGACSEDSIGTMAVEAKEDTIQVQAFNQVIHLPVVPSQGKASGPRIHKGIKITKVFDKASPLLYQALCDGEQIAELNIEWYRINAAGEPEHYYSHTLRDAVITRIEAFMPDCQNPKNNMFTHMENIWVNYKAIEVAHEVCGTAGADEWGGAE
jgi:type VI secretion system secreted protein Hcp